RLHGGAPAHVIPMIDEVAATGDPERYVEELLSRGDRIMGFGHRVYRAEDPRARLLRRTAEELGSPLVGAAKALEEAALEALQKRHPERVLATNVEYWAAVVLDVANIPAKLTPAMFACARVAGWSAHILEQKRAARLIRPAARYTGPGPRSLSLLSCGSPRRLPRRTPLHRRETRRLSLGCGRSGTRRSRPAPAMPTTAAAPRPIPRAA